MITQKQYWDAREAKDEANKIIWQFEQEEQVRGDKRLFKSLQDGYQDQNRTYTTGERQLSQRLDCAIGRLVAA